MADSEVDVLAAAIGRALDRLSDSFDLQQLRFAAALHLVKAAPGWWRGPGVSRHGGDHHGCTTRRWLVQR
jgi:hypothetical protein